MLVGLVLAAGAGSRYGGPKALARTPEGAGWLRLAVEALGAGGCERVVVALGAGADEARELLADAAGGGDTGGTAVETVVVPDWAQGLSATLRTGLATAFAGPGDAVVILTVDTPDLPAAAVRRVAAAAGATSTPATAATALARATYADAPGHPVVVGRDHAAALIASLAGDRGAGPYLRRHGAREIPCEDLWDGADIDAPAPPR